jgi:hypothetical protein
VQSALTASEQSLLTRVAASYERVTTLIGLRLRPELGATFETIALLANATIRGLVIMAPAAPGVATTRVLANPFGAPEPAEWSQPALGIASIAMTFIEPDPAIEWTAEHLAEVRAALMSADWLGI